VTDYLSSEELLTRLSQSHPESALYFEVLYTRYHRRLSQYFFKRRCEPDLVEDLIQQTMIYLFEKRTRYRLGASAEGWIFIIARSVLLDCLRSDRGHLQKKNQYEQFILSQNELLGSYSREEDEPLSSALSKEDLKLLSDRFEKGLSFREMAVSWGVSSESLRKRVSRIYQYLKRRKSRGSRV